MTIRKRRLPAVAQMEHLQLMASGAVVQVKWNHRTQRRNFTWLNAPGRPHWATVVSMWRAGWIRQTKDPGSLKDTGRFVITAMGRRALLVALCRETGQRRAQKDRNLAIG